MAQRRWWVPTLTPCGGKLKTKTEVAGYKMDEGRGHTDEREGGETPSEKRKRKRERREEKNQKRRNNQLLGEKKIATGQQKEKMQKTVIRRM